jgi:hypothetical protein
MSVLKLENQQLRSMQACLERKLLQLTTKRKCEFDDRVPSVRKPITRQAARLRPPRLVRIPQMILEV